MCNHPHGSAGVRGNNFKKAVMEVATMELFCFLCHRKDNNYARICMQQF